MSEERRKKVVDSLTLLSKSGFDFEILHPFTHYRIRGISFWPTTGKYFDPRTGQKGRGVENLIRLIKKFDKEDTELENPNDDHLMGILIQFGEGNIGIDEAFKEIKTLAEQL